MPTVEAASHALAGAIGSFIAMAAFYPLDNLRTRLQTHVEQQKKVFIEAKNVQSSSVAIGSAPVRRPSFSDEFSHRDGYHYTGTIDLARQILEKEGLQGFYHGMESALIGVTASSGIYFFWYSLLKKLALRAAAANNGKKRETLFPMENILVASIAGVFNVFGTLPIWTVNTRMTLARKSDGYSSLSETVKKILSDEGFVGLYKGLIPSLLLVFNPIVQFVTYEQMVRILSRRFKGIAGNPKLSAAEYFLLGALSKAAATIVTYPYQVLKSRLQATRSSHHTMLSMAQEMWNEPRFPEAFFRGLNAKLSQTVLNAALMHVIQEKLVRLIFRFLKSLVK